MHLPYALAYALAVFTCPIHLPRPFRCAVLTTFFLRFTAGEYAVGPLPKEFSKAKSAKKANSNQERKSDKAPSPSSSSSSASASLPPASKRKRHDLQTDIAKKRKPTPKKPDRACLWGNVPIFVMDDKRPTFRNFVAASQLSLVKAWKKNQQARYAVNQLYECLLRTGLSYGAINIYHTVWFGYRVGSIMYMSPPVDHRRNTPSQLQCYAYCLDLAKALCAETASVADSDDDEDGGDGDGEEDATAKGGEDGEAHNDAGAHNDPADDCGGDKEDAGDEDDNLSGEDDDLGGEPEAADNRNAHDSQPLRALASRVPVLGRGRCGCVRLVNGNAVKSVPVSSSLLTEIQHEAMVYDTLKHLQGAELATMHFSGMVSKRRYGLVLDAVGFALSTGMLSAPQRRWFKQKARRALEVLHRNNWLHGDIRLCNFALKRSRSAIIDPTDDVVILDLGFSSRSSNADEKEQEILELEAAF
jgi:hypothetical protein